METLCPPMCAATDRLHLGNLYTWILIDTYKKAARLRGEKVIARESWGCMSKKLEEEVISQNPDYSSEEIREECSKRTEKNIEHARELFAKYSFEFDLPTIRDDSVEYQNLINENLEKLMRKGKIDKDFNLILPTTDKVIEIAKTIDWIPKDIWKRYYGISTLKGVDKIPVLRQGIYGITTKGIKDKIFGQRFVQSFLPSFYEQEGYKIDVGIFGMDVLTVWLYFAIVNHDSKPFDRIGLSGMVLNSSGKKISKYDKEVKLIDQIQDHPDNVRSFFLKQSFGRDFKTPDNFKDEERLRRKVYNCLIFLKQYPKIKENADFSEYLSKVRSFSKTLSNDFYNLNFSEAYRKFYDFVYNDVSKGFINEVRGKGISKKDLKFFLNEFLNISEVFIPNTIKEMKSEQGSHKNLISLL